VKNEDVLKLLLPIELGGSDADDRAVEGKHIDHIIELSDQLLKEMFPDDTDELLTDWERVYGLVQADLPLFQRLQNFLSAYRREPRLDVLYIKEVVRPFVGYDVEVEEYMVFRCDDPRCLTDDDKFALEEDHVFQFTVIIDNALIQTVGYDPAAVQTAMNKAKPAHTNGVLDTGSAGFFCDDPNSLTDLTLLAI
jgi:uncharacterized protein YmfQ (DUF2313 family)